MLKPTGETGGDVGETEVMTSMIGDDYRTPS